MANIKESLESAFNSYITTRKRGYKGYDCKCGKIFVTIFGAVNHFKDEQCTKLIEKNNDKIVESSTLISTSSEREPTKTKKQDTEKIGIKIRTCELCNDNEKYTDEKFDQHLIIEHFGHIAKNLKKNPFPSTCKCSALLENYDSALNHIAISHNLFRDQYEKALKKRKSMSKEVKPNKNIEEVSSNNMDSNIQCSSSVSLSTGPKRDSGSSPSNSNQRSSSVLDKAKDVQNTQSVLPDSIDHEPRIGTKRKFDDLQHTEDVIEMVQPLVSMFLNTHFPSEGKISCLSAISSLITKDVKVRDYLVKKDIIEDIANLAEKVENQPKDLNIIGRIFFQLNGINEGKELIGEVRMPIRAYEKLQSEMKKFEVSLNPEDFAFSSEESTSKRIKNEIKTENIKTKQE